MGVFSSKTKIDVFSNAIQLVDEDYDPLAEAIVASVIEDSDITEAILASANAGQAKYVRSMLKYARDHYTLGLPSGVRHTTTLIDNTVIASAITDSESLPYGCLVDYNFLTELSVDWAVLPFLLGARAYNIDTDTIHTFPDGMNLPLTHDDNFGGTWPLVHTVTTESITFDITTRIATLTYKIQPTYRTRHAGGYFLVTMPVWYFEEEIPINDGLRIGRQYCMAKYFRLDSGGQHIDENRWWFYDIATGEYPAIDQDYVFELEDSFFPVVPVRYNNEDLTDVSKHGTPLYETSKKLLKKVGVDFDLLGEKIEENPDVSEIDHAYFMYGVNLQTEDQASIRYLVEYFDLLYDEQALNQHNFTDFRINDGTNLVNNDVFNAYGLLAPTGINTHTEHDTWWGHVVDWNTDAAATLTEHGLDTSVWFSFISSVLKHGVIGKVGHCTKELVAALPYTPGWRLNEDVRTERIILKHQVSEGTYKEVVVVGLVHSSRIYKNDTVVTYIEDLINDDENDGFVIPLHYGVCKRLPVRLENEIYLQAPHIVINGIVKTKVRWYQRGAFKFVMLGLALAVSIITGNWWIVGVALAMEVAAQVLSPKILMAIRVAYIIYTIYTLNWGEAASELSGAAQFLGNVQALVNLSQIPMELRTIHLQGEMEDLALEQELQDKKFEELWAALATDSLLDAGLLLNTPRLSSIPNESPSAFYARTLRNNAGLLALDVVEHYHDALLTLPEPDYSFGST